MIDFLGNSLNIGNRVIYIMPGYREYKTGYIKRFTKKLVIIDLDNEYSGTMGEIKQYPIQLIKID